MKKILYLIEFIAAYPFILLARILPLPASTFIAGKLGEIAYLLMGKRRRIALDNIDHAFGSSITLKRKKEISLGSFRHAAAAFMELLIMPKLLKKAEMRFEFVGYEHMQKLVDRNQGVVFVVSHVGSFECLEVFSFLKPIHHKVVVKSLKNRYFDRFINNMRLKTGITPIPKENAAKLSLATLKQKGVMSILVDQWAGPQGIWADFFGRKTSTTSLPTRLAQHSGAGLIMGCCIRVKPGYYRFEFFEEIPVPDKTEATEKAITERINRDLEAMIRRHPEQWTWGHRRWKNKPDAVREI